MYDSILKLLYDSTPEFNLFSSQHFIALGCGTLIILFIIYRKSALQRQKSEGLRWFLVGIFLIQQFLLYSWYHFTGNFDIHDALPLYPCRLLQVMTIIMLITKNRTLFDMLTMLGIPAAMTALLLVDTNGLGFPNAMFIQFFMGHFMMIISPLFMKYRYQFNVRTFNYKRVVHMIAGYFVVVAFINIWLRTNYGYVSAPPQALSFINGVPQIIYTFAYFLIYVAVAYISLRIATHRHEVAVEWVITEK